MAVQGNPIAGVPAALSVNKLIGLKQIAPGVLQLVQIDLSLISGAGSSADLNAVRDRVTELEDYTDTLPSVLSAKAVKGIDVASGARVSVKAANIASASTVDLSLADGDYTTVTGTATVTSFGVVTSGIERTLVFAAAGLTIQYNAVSLITHTGKDVVTKAGDIATLRSEGAGNWRIVNYQEFGGLSEAEAAGKLVRKQTGPLVAQAIYTGGGTFTPLSTDRNGNVQLAIDNTTGAVIGAGGSSSAAAIVDPSYASVVTIGDSITVGVASSSDSLRWTSLVAAAWGATETNQGISGTVLQNSVDASGSPRANNGRDRFVAAMTGASIRASAIIAYGFNDARYTAAPATMNVANYQNDLGEVTAGLITRGYRPEDITIVAPYYITDAGLASGSTGFTGQTRSGFEAYVAAARAVAMDMGTQYYDAYAWLRDNGGGLLISDDNIHPTDAGHAMIALGCRTKRRLINQRIRPLGLAGSSPGAGALSLTWSVVPGAVSYDHQYSVASSNVWSAQSNAAGETKAWSGLSGGTYFARVRAVFGDGGKSPWSFTPITTVV